MNRDSEHCPSCGEEWVGESPKDDWYIVWRCERCGYWKDNYGGVRERGFSQYQLDMINQLTRGEGEGDE